jgi:hypothetical protein
MPRSPPITRTQTHTTPPRHPITLHTTTLHSTPLHHIAPDHAATATGLPHRDQQRQQPPVSAYTYTPRVVGRMIAAGRVNAVAYATRAAGAGNCAWAVARLRESVSGTARTPVHPGACAPSSTCQSTVRFPTGTNDSLQGESHHRHMGCAARCIRSLHPLPSSHRYTTSDRRDSHGDTG